MFPNLQDGEGVAGLKYREITFRLPLQCRLSIIEGVALGKALASSGGIVTNGW